MTIAEIIKALNDALPKSTEPVSKSYVNPLAAAMLHNAGYDVASMDGTVFKAETDTNYGFADFTRARHFQGLPAREQVYLINDTSWFLERIPKISHNTNIVPIDMWTGIPEQLVDTQRIASDPQANDIVKAKRANHAVIFGNEIYVPHVERQIDLPIEVIRQYLYDPDFEQRLEMFFSREISNDLTRLAVNGTNNDFSGGDFYRLAKSFSLQIAESKGIKTLPSGISRFVGKYGKLVTPVKVNAPLIRFITPFSDIFGSDTAALYTASAGSLAVSGGVLNWTGTSWTGGNCTYNNVIELIENVKYVLSADLKMTGGTGTGTVIVLDLAGNVVASSNALALTTNAKKVSVSFNSMSMKGVRVRITCAQVSANNGFIVDNILLDRAINKFEYFDMQNIMDILIDKSNEDYSVDDGMYEFQMSRTDASLYAQALRTPIHITVDGKIIPMATETRENRIVGGVTNLEYRGFPIVIVPFAKSMNNGGVIVFGPATQEFRIATQDIFSFVRKYEERLETGGEGYKYTYHMYQNFGIRNPGKFAIAQGTGCTFQCEDLIISTSKEIIGTRIGSSASAVAISKAANPSSYIFCDTPGSEIYYSTTSANLDSYGLAVLETRAENVNLSSLANGTYYVVAFFNGVCSPSTKMTLTVGA